jgi:hypothetical protein
MVLMTIIQAASHAAWQQSCLIMTQSQLNYRMPMSIHLDLGAKYCCERILCPQNANCGTHIRFKQQGQYDNLYLWLKFHPDITWSQFALPITKDIAKQD